MSGGPPFVIFSVFVRQEPANLNALTEKKSFRRGQARTDGILPFNRAAPGRGRYGMDPDRQWAH
jgi:hypothetical protein